MNTKSFSITVLGAAVLLAGGIASQPALAQSKKDLKDASHHRQNTKNGWRNTAIGSGAVGLYGLIKGDKAAAAVGLGGAAYSASRYEHDRRSQAGIDAARRNRGSGAYVTRNGRAYKRVVSYKNGVRKVRYVRA